MGRERTLALALAASCVLVVRQAHGEPSKAKSSPSTTPAPAANGVRASIGVGLRFPVGRATAEPGDMLSGRYSPQFAIQTDLGVQFARSFFVAVYGGASAGWSGTSPRSCIAGYDELAVCKSITLAAGIGLQYSLAPSAKLNPWLGYGFGYELARLGISKDPPPRAESVTSTGFTYARFSAGFDLRRKEGCGPFVDAAFGQFTSTNTDFSGGREYHTRIHDRAFHLWLTAGIRIVINP